LVISYQEFVDKNPITRLSADARAVMANLSYTLTFIKSGLALSFAGQLTNAETAGLRSQIAGGNSSVSANFMKNALAWSFTMGYAATKNNGVTANGTFNSATRFSYNIDRFNTLSLDVTYLGNAARAAGAQSFNEVIVNLTYAARFSL
jgi:hypothetical protein